MPSLAGAVTLLTALAVPGSATTDYTRTVVSTPRPDSTIYTRLSAYGVPGMNFGDFTGRAASTEVAFTVPVSIVPVLTFGDVTDVDIDITASMSPVLTASALVGQAKAVSASVVPVATWTLGGLTKTGDTAKAASATVTPVVTVGTSLVVQVAQAVSVIPVVTYTSGTLATSDSKLVDVSIIPSLSLEYQANIQLGEISYSRGMDIVPSLTVTARVVAAGDVDRIKTKLLPVGRIKTRIT